MAAAWIALQFVRSVIGGLFLRYLGGSALVKVSASLTLRLGQSPPVVELAVVAFATRMSGLFVVMKDSLCGREGMSISNGVGASIFNVLCILGNAATMNPPDTSGIARRELLAMSAIVLPKFWRGCVENCHERGGLIVCYDMANTMVLDAMDGARNAPMPPSHAARLAGDSCATALPRNCRRRSRRICLQSTS